MEVKLHVSSSPHFKSNNSTRRIMLDVIIALCPAAIAACVIFGMRSLVLIAVCVATCVLLEYVSRKIMKRDTTIGDLSAVVTGLLLALNLPVDINPLIAMFGCLIAIVVVKQMFGGIGMNFVNPALAARIVLLVSFPSAMMHWVPALGAPQAAAVDAATSATPLVAEPGVYSYVDLLLGRCSGSIGEVCAVALILGGIYLVIRRVISPIIPCVYLATAALMSLIVGLDPLYQLLSGGILLGAIFMATDYTTSPVTKWGKVIFAFGCGVLTILLRAFSNMPEGVSFSILLMNILVPLIERATVPRTLGYVKKKKGAQK
ncbi:MAG: RnfABCDGE type electron transport complex subunit D [Ruminococcus sp.]|uniref:RnfABCDGE type electron transport complex subunit D n=1 Tax=Ruminococcus sp. TaxID=41978 RepID=UPI002873C647|nr:RnfABCDGE type electron transport complex subunit D [Ruminococcus sp.]MBQ3286236.1 RnfABCDGE type electron transport complex subunit D [Ruminococcus sp.]